MIRDAATDRTNLELVLRLAGHLDRRLSPITLDQFVADIDEIDLTAYRIAMIGETTNKLSSDVKGDYPAIPWAEIYRVRHIVAHDYEGLRPELLWWHAKQPLAELVTACRQALAKTS